MTEMNTPIYEIRVRGRLSPSWNAWFDGLDVSSDANGTSVIRGPVVDQAALHGLLQRLRDVGLELESLVHIEPDPTGAEDLPTNHTNPSGATS